MGSHFGVGEFTTHYRIYSSGDWDVHWGYGLLTHGHIGLPIWFEGTKKNRPCCGSVYSFNKSSCGSPFGAADIAWYLRRKELYTQNRKHPFRWFSTPTSTERGHFLQAPRNICAVQQSSKGPKETPFGTSTVSVFWSGKSRPQLEAIVRDCRITEAVTVKGCKKEGRALPTLLPHGL